MKLSTHVQTIQKRCEDQENQGAEAREATERNQKTQILANGDTHQDNCWLIYFHFNLCLNL
jgi:hypothetical protein